LRLLRCQSKGLFLAPGAKAQSNVELVNAKMNDLGIFIAGALTGVVGALVSSYFAYRSARDDRTFEARTSACVTLESQRNQQFDRVGDVQGYVVDPSKTATLTHLPIDYEANALIAVALSHPVRRLVTELNEAMETYFERFNVYENARRDSRSELLGSINDAYLEYLNVSDKLEAAIRDEAGVAR
jgi:hypothetical protein